MNNFSNNFSNNLFLSVEKEIEQEEKDALLAKKIPVGREEIRIPVSISAERQQSRLSEEKLSVISSAVCEIIGISISLLVPNIPISFVYENPLARYRNAVKIATLSRKEQMNLSPEILAGTMLSFIETAMLLDKKGSYRAEEFNRFLTHSMTQEELVENVHLLKKIVESKADKKVLSERLPHISFCMPYEHIAFQDWVKTLISICFPETKKTTTTEEEKVSVKIPVKSPSVRISIAQNSAIKRLTKSLLAQRIISNKAAGIFLWLIEGDNIKNLTAEQKAKYILYLTEKESLEAEQLAMHISSLRLKVTELNLEDEMIEITETEKKPSFLALLAQKKGN